MRVAKLKKEIEIPLAMKFAVYDDIIKDLRKYAEIKFQNGEIAMAHGILKAVCKIKQKADEERQEYEKVIQR